MKRISHLTIAICAFLSLVGCDTVMNPSHEVSDNSFEVKTAIEWNAERMSYVANISLAKGEPGEYQFCYNIDSVSTLQIMDMSKSPVKSGSVLNLSKEAPLQFLLPSLNSDAKHSLNMEFSREGVCRKYSVALESGEKAIFTLSVNAAANLQNSILTIKGCEGSSKGQYDISFQIDGKDCKEVMYNGSVVDKGITLDFSIGDTFSFALPSLISGQHTVTVKASTVYNSFSATAVYTEPSRFLFEAKVVWDAEYMANMLIVSLLQGEAGEYALDYEIRGGNLPEEIASKINYLTTVSGDVFSSGSKISLTKEPVCFLLPSHAEGEAYDIVLKISNDDLSKEKAVNLAGVSNSIIKMEVDALENYTYSQIKLSNLRGEEATSYKVSFKMDGTPLAGVKYNGNEIKSNISVNFQSIWEHKFELPYISFGTHTIEVTISSSKTSRSHSVTFKEPKRKSTTLELAYNSFTGKLTMASDHNPYSTNFSISTSITVKGKVTYRHVQAIGIADPQTEYFTETAEYTIKITPGITASAIDNGVLKKTLDKVFSNTRTDAANWIGNGNARELHADITSVDLKFTIHSLGANEGCTPVNITPKSSSSFPIKYTYTGNTWLQNSGYVKTVSPSFTINGKSATSATEL